jgi:hypothetical protein
VELLMTASIFELMALTTESAQLWTVWYRHVAAGLIGGLPASWWLCDAPDQPLVDESLASFVSRCSPSRCFKLVGGELVARPCGRGD